MRQMQVSMSMWKNNRWAITTGTLLLILWEIASRIVQIDHILPGPISILKCLWELRETLLIQHLPSTLAAVLAGFILSALIGVFCAILMDRSPVLEAMIYPFILLTQTIPVMCITPLFVLWFGYTMGARILAIILGTFFTIAVNTYDGFRLSRRETLELMTTYGGNSRQIFREVKLPTALPNLMTSLKITFPWAVVGAAVAEWLGATQGLGYYSKLMVTRMNGPAVYASVLLLTIIAMAGIALIKWIDCRYVVWRNEI